MGTTEDVLLRYAIAQDHDYEAELVDEENGEVVVMSATQPPVRVNMAQDRPWCSCDEDAIAGTCTHVLFIAEQDWPIADRFKEALEADLDLTTEEISELSRQLSSRHQEQEALREALRLLETESVSFPNSK